MCGPAEKQLRDRGLKKRAIEPRGAYPARRNSLYHFGSARFSPALAPRFP